MVPDRACLSGSVARVLGQGEVLMGREWRCTSCRKLLGVQEGVRLSLRFARGYDYDVGLPVKAKCWRCGETNELRHKGTET